MLDAHETCKNDCNTCRRTNCSQVSFVPGEDINPEIHEDTDGEVIENLAMLIRRLLSGADVAASAMDYLARKGLNGNPLRAVGEEDGSPYQV
jgi:hypothetical protein